MSAPVRASSGAAAVGSNATNGASSFDWNAPMPWYGGLAMQAGQIGGWIGAMLIQQGSQESIFAAREASTEKNLKVEKKYANKLADHAVKMAHNKGEDKRELTKLHQRQETDVVRQGYRQQLEWVKLERQERDRGTPA